MKKIVSACLLISMLLLPVSLVIGFSYLGKAHPLEQNTVSNASFLAGSEKDMKIVFLDLLDVHRFVPNPFQNWIQYSIPTPKIIQESRLE